MVGWRNQPKRGRLFGGFAMSEQDSNDTTTLEFSRRGLLASVGALAVGANAPARAEITKADFRDLPPYGNGTLPDGARSRLIPNVNGLRRFAAMQHDVGNRLIFLTQSLAGVDPEPVIRVLRWASPTGYAFGGRKAPRGAAVTSAFV
jgi:hypothetical protein